MENYKFNTYRTNKSGEIIIEAKSEQSAINKITKMNNIDLREIIDNEKQVESRVEEKLLVFYKGNLIRKL